MIILEYKEEKHEFGESGIDKPAPGIMWVFYREGHPYMVDFICPCGCGNTCPIPLKIPDFTSLEGPGIKWSFDQKNLTISPSIRWLSGCKAHFNITNGKVIIHEDSGK